eukprot:scaffold13619_cov166-Isochrysis_galbana.AAC.1
MDRAWIAWDRRGSPWIAWIAWIAVDRVDRVDRGLDPNGSSCQGMPDGWANPVRIGGSNLLMPQDRPTDTIR